MTKLQDGDRLDGEENTIKVKVRDPLSLPQGPITRSRSKKFQEALIGYVQEWATNKESHVRVDSNEKENKGG